MQFSSVSAMTPRDREEQQLRLVEDAAGEREPGGLLVELRQEERHARHGEHAGALAPRPRLAILRVEGVGHQLVHGRDVARAAGAQRERLSRHQLPFTLASGARP